MATDEEIGRNLVRLRGERSQKDVADLMRKRGFRWSQATVWAVEKGERPLRLTEAESLGAVLDVHFPTLLASENQLSLMEGYRAFYGLLEQIDDLAYKSFEAQRWLAALIDVMPADDLEADMTVETIKRTAVDAAYEGLGRAEAQYRSTVEDSGSKNGTRSEPSRHEFMDAFITHVREEIEDRARSTAFGTDRDDEERLDRAEG